MSVAPGKIGWSTMLHRSVSFVMSTMSHRSVSCHVSRFQPCLTSQCHLSCHRSVSFVLSTMSHRSVSCHVSGFQPCLTSQCHLSCQPCLRSVSFVMSTMSHRSVSCQWVVNHASQVSVMSCQWMITVPHRSVSSAMSVVADSNIAVLVLSCHCHASCVE